MADLQPSLDIKLKLLKYLLSAKEARRSPNIAVFGADVTENFPEKLTQSSDELEQVCDTEIQIWMEECETPHKKRRIGHEADSEYDRLMTRWNVVWDEILVDHWYWVVTKPGPICGRCDAVPIEFRAKVKEMVEANAEKDKNVKLSLARKAVAQKEQVTPQSRTEDPKYEFDAEKLKEVVDSVKMRAEETGKPDLAAAVQRIYENALSDKKLRVVLEASLTQTASPSQSEQFQQYIRAVKRKLKSEKETGTDKAGQQGPPAKVTRSQVTVHDVEDDSVRNVSMDGHGSERTMLDSAYASEQKEDTAEEDQETNMTVEITRLQGESYNKPGSDPAASLVATQEVDVAKAEEGASKRRKRADSDDSGRCHPPSKKRYATSETSKLPEGIISRDSIPLPEASDTEFEAATEADLDKTVRSSTSAEASRQAIEDEHDPVSSTLDGNNSLASLASQTLQPMHGDGNTTEQQTKIGAKQSTAHPSERPTTTPGPPRVPPEHLTAEEGTHAYNIITGAAAEAINPALSRLEAKVDGLVSSQTPQLRFPSMSPFAATAPTGQGANMSDALASQDLDKLVKSLKSGDVDEQNTELVHVISKLAEKAAAASIHAAEAARQAGIVARDASQILMHLSSQNPRTGRSIKGRGKR